MCLNNSDFSRSGWTRELVLLGKPLTFEGLSDVLSGEDRPRGCGRGFGQCGCADRPGGMGTSGHLSWTWNLNLLDWGWR